jgi:hypothetical protein
MHSIRRGTTLKKNPNSPLLRILVAVAPLLMFSGHGAVAGGADPQWRQAPLLFAGFAFSGDEKNERALYPYSAELSAETSGQFLNDTLKKKLMSRASLADRVSAGLSDGKTDVTSIAFALVQENHETQMVDGRYWGIVTLQADVLAFNESSHSVVASYPIRTRLAHVKNAPFTDADFRAMTREAYTSDDPGANIFDLWLNRFEKIQIRPGAVRRLRVTDITITPEAERVLREAGKSTPAIRNQVANFLEAAVAEGAGISLVPQSVGAAIGNNMSLLFADGKSSDLVLPPADFALTFAIRDFVSTTLDQPQYFQDVFRVKGTIALKETETAHVYLDENIYDTLIVTRPKRADVRLSQWDQYFKVLQELIFTVGREMNTVDESWLKQNASRALEAKAGFIQSRDLLAKLR